MMLGSGRFSPMPDVQPTATGTLYATPVPHLLVYVLDRQLDGTLVFQTPDGGRSAILLEGGAPSKARTAAPVIHLGRLLLEMGLIDEPTHNRTLAEVAKTKQLHGELLIRDNAIDEGTLRAALREQIARQVLWMFTLPEDTVYGFYANTNFLEQWGAPESTRVQPLGLLWRGIRAHADDRRVTTTLARLGNIVLHLHPDGQVGRFNLERGEQAIIDVLRAKPQTLDELSRAGLLPEVTLRRLIYALAITRHLEVGVPGAVPIGVDEAPSSSRIAITDGSAQVRRRRRLTTGKRRAMPPAPGSSPAPAVQEEVPAAEKPLALASAAEKPPLAKPSPSPEMLAFMDEIRSLSERIGKQNYYEILGVPEDAQKGVIQGAFFQLAKRWHPDRISNEVGELRDEATRIFAKMSEAHQVLSDDRLRAEYTDVLKEGGASAGEQDEIQAVLRAATAFQKAEVLLKRNNLADAEEHARVAVESDPSQADYVALYTWIQSQKPGCDDTTLRALISKLNQAVSGEPENLRARWYRGQLLKRIGDYDAAVRDFRFVVERDAKHLDATREIRLYEMRRSAVKTPSTRMSSVPPRPGSSKPPGAASRPSPRPPPDKKGLMNKDLGNLFGKWFKR